jgi:hypothetical protein
VGGGCRGGGAGWPAYLAEFIMTMMMLIIIIIIIMYI